MYTRVKLGSRGFHVVKQRGETLLLRGMEYVGYRKSMGGLTSSIFKESVEWFQGATLQSVGTQGVIIKGVKIS